LVEGGMKEVWGVIFLRGGLFAVVFSSG